MPDTQTIMTALTRRFGCDHPLVQAGMGFVGMKPALARAVCNAGAIGTIGVGPMLDSELRAAIEDLRATTGGLFNLNFLTPLDNDSKIRLCAEMQVPIVSFHWGHPTDSHRTLLQDAGCSVWEQVGSVEAGRRAAGDGIEVVIAQGSESGGHNYGVAPTFVLTPMMVDALDGTLVLAAGGVTDGRGVAAALALGAAGVWIGTRFAAAQEANTHPEHHRRILAAGENDTVLSGIFAPEMPSFNPMRVLRNRVVDEFTARLAEVPVDRKTQTVIGHTQINDHDVTLRKFHGTPPTPETSGDFEEMPWLAGEGAAMITAIEPAADIVTRLMRDAAACLQTLAGAVTVDLTEKVSGLRD